MADEYRNENGQLKNGHPGLKPIGAENKLTRKAKWLLNAFYDEVKRQGVGSLVNDASASDKIRAILAALPKNIEHSGPDGGPIDSKITIEFVKSDSEIS
jgi:hypothetical protein